MTKTMRAARMHAVGQPLSIDEVDIPVPRSTDVLIEVKACGIVPNLGNVLNHLKEWFPHLHLPELPAIFGLDATGLVAAKGAQVHGIDVGQRVYVNPARYCGGCRYCRAGDTTACEYYSFNGYFGFGPKSQRMFEDYPYGGMCEYRSRGHQPAGGAHPHIRGRRRPAQHPDRPRWRAPLPLHRRVDHRRPWGERAAMERARPLSCRVSLNGELSVTLAAYRSAPALAYSRRVQMRAAWHQCPADAVHAKRRRPASALLPR